MTASRTFSRFISELRAGDIPAKTLDNARGRILDFIAAAGAGYKVNRAANEVVKSTICEFGSVEKSRLLFGEGRMSVPDAAYMNAFYGHGADLDDGHMLSSGHPGVVVVPAVLSVAESIHADAMDVLTAVVCGYEVYVRLSNTIMPSHLHRGFHGTGTVGTVAAAAAVAKLLGLDEERIHRAISLGSVSAAGLFEVSESGQSIKPVNPATAARTGIVSAYLAKNGAEAPENPFEGNRGFFKAFADSLKMDEINEGLGTKFSIDYCYVKMYPACRHTHAIIDCAVEMHDKRMFELGEVSAIRIFSYENSCKITGNIFYPKDAGEGKFSMPYGVALGLTKGNFTLDDLVDPAGMSEEAKTLISKMTVICEPGLEVRSKMIRGARLEVDLCDGRTITVALNQPKGEAVSPFSKEEMKKKLVAYTGGVLNRGEQDAIFRACYSLGAGTSTEDLIGLITKNC